jgi:hypothetical protein
MRKSLISDEYTVLKSITYAVGSILWLFFAVSYGAMISYLSEQSIFPEKFKSIENVFVFFCLMPAIPMLASGITMLIRIQWLIELDVRIEAKRRAVRRRAQKVAGGKL